MSIHRIISDATQAVSVAGEAALPIAIWGTATGTGAETVNVVDGDGTVVSVGFPAKVIRAWMISRDTNSVDVTLLTGGDALTAATDKGGTDDAIVDFTAIVAEQDELAAADTLTATFSGAGVVDIFLLLIPIPG